MSPNISHSHSSFILIPLGIALNVVLGTLVNLLKLPLYLDAIGTILVTLLVGWQAGLIVGIGSFVFMSILISPTYIYFVGTQAAIATYIYLMAARLSSFQSKRKTVFTGIGLGIVTGIVSAPVIVYVFGGASGTGRDFITAFLANSGMQILESVILSGAQIEPIDKCLQVLTAYYLIKTTPKSLLHQFSNPVLQRNQLVDSAHES